LAITIDFDRVLRDLAGSALVGFEVTTARSAAAIPADGKAKDQGGEDLPSLAKSTTAKRGVKQH
jgi:hypothetical protein